MQKSHRQSQLGVTVRRLFKQKSCCHVIAISQAGIAAATLTKMVGFRSKRKKKTKNAPSISFPSFRNSAYFQSMPSEPERESNPVAMVGRRIR